MRHAQRFLSLFPGTNAPVQPIFHLEEPPERIRSKSPAPAEEVPSRHFRLCSHPRCDFVVVSAGGHEVSQPIRRQSRSLKKSAIHRAVEAIGAGLPKEVCATFVDQSCGPHWELAQGGARTPWCQAIKVECEEAEFFGVHAVSSNEGVRGLGGADKAGRLGVT
jgi:hypothetical protein